MRVISEDMKNYQNSLQVQRLIQTLGDKDNYWLNDGESG